MIIGVVSTRFAGLDGVSLEAAKVASALAETGHESVWFAGELGPGFRPGVEFVAAHFASQSNQELEAACFGEAPFGPGVNDAIEARAELLEGALERFIAEFAVEVLLVHNALSIPMQLPLGVALRGVIERTGIAAIGYHHDFGWERSRFVDCAVPDVLDETFPPILPNLRHVVINRDARDQLESRRGVQAALLPNVMDFARPPPVGDGSGYRASVGLDSADVVLLQPTRVIPRKGIEHTIRLAAALGDRAIKVVVSHPDDRDDEYWTQLLDLAHDLDVDLRMGTPGSDAEALGDAYAAADLVCFPSLIEGFGNALVETIYHRKPIFINRYPVYARDIAPLGIEAAEIDGEVGGRVVSQVSRWLADPDLTSDLVARNYEIGEEHFSYDVVRQVLGPLLEV